MLIAMVRGSGDEPRMGVRKAAKTVLGLVCFDVYVFVLAVLVSLLGWLLPQQITTFVAVCVIGFSWVPVGLFPWEKVGLGGLSGIRPQGPVVRRSHSRRTEFASSSAIFSSSSPNPRVDHSSRHSSAVGCACGRT